MRGYSAVGALAGLLSVAGPVAAADETAAGTTVLTAQSPWRCYFVWQDELVQFADGEVAAFEMVRGQKGPQKVAATPAPTAAPPVDWAAAGFDDRDWVTSPGPIVHNPYDHALAAIFLRGVFQVTDPEKAGDLALSLAYRGGARVLLNGREIARADLPEGDLIAAAPANPYPKEAYVTADGMIIHTRSEDQSGVTLRMRTLTAKVPASGLVEGVNVLAIELHRAPTSELYFTAERPTRGQVNYEWSMCGFEALSLVAPADAAVAPNVGRPAAVETWVGSPVLDAWDGAPGRPFRDGEPLRIAGTRNGAFTGVVMVRSPKAITEIAVTPPDLKAGNGAATIPVAAWQVRYAVAGDPPVPEAETRYPKGSTYLGVLAPAAPVPVAVPEGGAGVTLPVWLTVTVPADAAAGDYRGAAALRVNGGEAVSVPVHLSVADWTLPDPKDFTAFAGIMEGPESVALQYQVPLWSEQHWALVETIFRHLGTAGVKSVFIPVIGQTNLGNEFSMVRWIRQADGTYAHDFSVVDRYLDLTVKYLGKVPVVCFYVWTPAHGGRAGWGKPSEAPKNESPMHFTLLDRATGRMTDAEGPDWGTPESVPFWRPVFEGLRQRLKQRGLEHSMALGMVSDYSPSQLAVKDLATVAPEARWVTHAHGLYLTFAGQPAAVASTVWKGRTPSRSTDRGKQYGWQNKVIQTMFARWGAQTMGHVQALCPPGLYHALLEGYQTAGFNGFSRMGADFWDVVKDSHGRGTSVISRYSFRNRPGPPTMTNGALLFPAAGGPLPTQRFEALRLGAQETEARIFIERALLDDAKRARLGDDLAARAQVCLDDRVTVILRAKSGQRGTSIGSDAGWLDYAAGYRARARDLFALAAEVAGKTGAAEVGSLP